MYGLVILGILSIDTFLFCILVLRYESFMGNTWNIGIYGILVVLESCGTKGLLLKVDILKIELSDTLSDLLFTGVLFNSVLFPLYETDNIEIFDKKGFFLYISRLPELRRNGLL